MFHLIKIPDDITSTNTTNCGRNGNERNPNKKRIVLANASPTKNSR